MFCPTRTFAHQEKRIVFVVFCHTWNLNNKLNGEIQYKLTFKKSISEHFSITCTTCPSCNFSRSLIMSPTSDGAFIKLVSGKIEIGPPRIQGNEDVKTIISHQSIDVSTSSFSGKHQGPG